jgi:hypothetical protein
MLVVVVLVAARKAASVELCACLSIPTILINLYVWRGVEQRCAAGYLRICVCYSTIHIYHTYLHIHMVQAHHIEQ